MLMAADVGLLQSRYRLTKQRAAVLRALGDGGHLSAETILKKVRAELPAVSLGTIYRTLDILREIGLVQAFTHGTDAARYEAAALLAVRQRGQRARCRTLAHRAGACDARALRRDRLLSDDHRALLRLRTAAHEWCGELDPRGPLRQPVLRRARCRQYRSGAQFQLGR